MIFRQPSYQQCVLVARLARSGTDADDQQLRDLVGPYAGNVIGVLIRRGLIYRNERGRWDLTESGAAIATELLGPGWKVAT